MPESVHPRLWIHPNSHISINTQRKAEQHFHYLSSICPGWKSLFNIYPCKASLGWSVKYCWKYKYEYPVFGCKVMHISNTPAVMIRLAWRHCEILCLLIWDLAMKWYYAELPFWWEKKQKCHLSGEKMIVFLTLLTTRYRWRLFPHLLPYLLSSSYTGAE